MTRRVIRFEQIEGAPLSADQRARALRLRLPWDERTRSRLVLMHDGGEAIAVHLARGTVLRDGTVLASTDGRHAIVEAAPQRLLRVSAAAPLLLKVVYHLANRHVAAQLGADHVVIEADPVLEKMARQLGARTEEIDAPFEPEAGAYGEHGYHGHHAEESDANASLGEQLSIEAHRRRAGGPPA